MVVSCRPDNESTKQRFTVLNISYFIFDYKAACFHKKWVFLCITYKGKVKSKILLVKQGGLWY